MTLEQRISAFVQLGKTLLAFGNGDTWPGFASGLSEDEYAEFNETIRTARLHNGWFTEENVRSAMRAIGANLTEEKLNDWIGKYRPEGGKRVAIIMAGNIPLVGFHDLLSVLISGHTALVKPASSDNVLMPAVIDLIRKIEPGFDERIEFVKGKLTDYDAVIATGSDNSARYFHSYFGHVPHIIRKNRTSVAVLSGNETEEELELLGRDVFEHYGLGCRNVSKVFVPADFDIDRLFKGIYPYADVINHHKYANNYDYNKAVMLMNREELLDNGFLLVKEDNGLFSPLAVLYFQRYTDKEEIEDFLKENTDQIQCIVSKDGIPFGTAQNPQLWDYADNVDTLAFLSDL